ncbi:MAG: hypothetical protein ACO32I_03540 [Candidatus Limnocylindrus sp.]
MQERLSEECNVLVRVMRDGTEIDRREGHNVWTNTGREYSALLKSYRPNGTDPFRNDRIAYVGLGGGTQPEDVTVLSLVTPLAFADDTTWLKRIDHTRTLFPEAGSRLTVRYTARFTASDFSGAEAFISECGLFTDGHPVTFQAGGRPTLLAEASRQSPLAYHTFSPIPKTPDIEIELIWELRH